MVSIDEKVLTKYLNQIESEDELKGCKRFVSNFFYTLSEDEPLEYSYANYLRDILLYSPTNKAINNNRTYLCWAFKDITHSSIEELAFIELVLGNQQPIISVLTEKEKEGFFKNQ